MAATSLKSLYPDGDALLKTGNQTVAGVITFSQSPIVPTPTTATQAGSKGYSDGISHGICQGRLTLETGVAISTTDQTAKTTLYFTPYNGNKIAVYDGSIWIVSSFTEKSLSLSGYTADKNYDIWIYDNSGTLTLDSTIWTDATTRATALTTQDGIYVKTGDATRRYLGTIRTTATTGQCEDSVTKRFVWNYYNQVNSNIYIKEATSHTYASTTRRAWNNNTSAQIQIVVGISTVASVSLLNAGNTYNELTVGIDSTTSDYGATCYNSASTLFVISGMTFPSFTQGSHSINVLERAVSGTASFSYTILNGVIKK